MKKFLISIFIFLAFPLFVSANIICNDGWTESKCADCHQGCCSHHKGCVNNTFNSSDPIINDVNSNDYLKIEDKSSSDNSTVTYLIFFLVTVGSILGVKRITKK